ncbi:MULTISPECIES: prephenate dehydratase [Staphylococcus]|uniref:Prephenate dehydratase n=1 Tax=Staphylococcus chromogenes TaxID=46126 RepID=A0AAE5T011_STACR|nr:MULTISPECIES: prephenate dehydratase domain-containing protein [Staphylococcus]KDP12467.1 prephenate dehydratase [Staphylococcus chromogenes MU 970]MBP0046578.1 prephenate dehydratase [Staphylococcus chromogenes]MBV5138305.1 prephenate dehydratase [Staphylococcus chromogenes]MBV5191794.1 prephenate dehydratase [Staphylococcus chromogenes]MBW3133222.1 prephenate dehydratase [Staphylococcus chromogenes]
MTLYYLGPKGTFSYLAALKYNTNDESFIPKENLYEVITALKSDASSRAIVPIENAIEGTINVVADSLVEYPFTVIQEVHLDIEFSLYGAKGTSIDEIQEVRSIAPAISQTQKFIHQHQLHYSYTQSTVESLQFIDASTAAIAPKGSGEAYGFTALAQNIEDYPHNVTRFLVLSNDEMPLEEGTQCLLLITPSRDQPGLLASILNTFALFNVNLSWIESRPLKTQLGRYRFYVQAEYPDEMTMKKITTILETLDFEIRHLGRFN